MLASGSLPCDSKGAGLRDFAWSYGLILGRTRGTFRALRIWSAARAFALVALVSSLVAASMLPRDFVDDVREGATVNADFAADFTGWAITLALLIILLVSALAAGRAVVTFGLLPKTAALGLRDTFGVSLYLGALELFWSALFVGAVDIDGPLYAELVFTGAGVVHLALGGFSYARGRPGVSRLRAAVVVSGLLVLSQTGLLAWFLATY